MLDICRLFIDMGAQVEARNSIGLTPLHCAADQGYVEIVRLLCNHRAGVKARSKVDLGHYIGQPYVATSLS
jgi:ankyrin repeat protein